MRELLQAQAEVFFGVLVTTGWEGAHRRMSLNFFGQLWGMCTI